MSAIVSVKELFAGRSGTPFEASSMHREYLRKFRVMVNSNKVGPVTVGFANGIPAPYSPYATEEESDLLALCTSIKAEQEHEDDWQSWIVDCQYSTQMPEGGGQGNLLSPDSASGEQNNPELEPPDIEWDWEVEQRALSKDLDGNPIVNSATQPFTPAVTFEVGHAILTYSRNELSFSRDKASKFSYVTNSDVFLGADPGTVLCYPPRGKRVFRGKAAYWRVTYKFRFGRQLDNGRLETVQPRLLDQGLCRLMNAKEKAAVPGVLLPVALKEPVPILKRGLPITQPVMLDGNGQEAKPRWVPNKPFGDRIRRKWKINVLEEEAVQEVIVIEQAVPIQLMPDPIYLEFRIYRKEKLNKIMTRIP